MTFARLVLLVSSVCSWFASTPARAMGSHPPDPGSQTQPPALKHVIVVVLENESFDESAEQPFIKKLIKRGALLSDFHAETHPSQPNYIAMIGGATLGVTNDNNVDLDARHLGELLEEKGLNWKVYAEDYPGGCFLGATSGRYARKHVPFLSFKNVQRNPARCARIVPSDAFDADLDADALPAFSMYIPNLDNDGHDTGIAYADQWLEKRFGKLIQDKNFLSESLFVLTFDESGYFSPTNHIATVLVGENVRKRYVSKENYDHYSLLRTIEVSLGLGSLGKNDAKASVITGVWR